MPCVSSLPRAVIHALAASVLVFVAVLCVPWTAPGQDPVDKPSGQEEPVPKYSEAVLAKAEKVLADNGLKRVGSQIQPASQSEYTRLISEETRQRRSLRLAQQAWNDADQAMVIFEQQYETLESQHGQLNAQFAVQGNPQGRNNELVARINATAAQLKQLARTRDTQKEELARHRATLSQSEEEYAELILKLRKEVEQMGEAIRLASEQKDVHIAFQVLATKYQSPAELDAEAMLSPLDRRVRKLEEAVFRESIPLENISGGMKVQAVIGLEPVQMLVDSGASVVLIPQELAEKMNIQPEANAKSMTMVTADGRRIAAKEVFLPRLRVGQFEAENVRAALLEESISGAQPLLGMSFLERFKFEIDAGQKTLKLLRIETKD
jgi:clan AA aspartic protease (TIGR02281 family)